MNDRSNLFGLLLLLLFCHPGIAHAGKHVVYRDKEYKFALHYPSSWAKMETTYERTRIKVKSNGGEGHQDCLVNVQPVPADDGVTLEKIATKSFADQYAKTIASLIPGTKILSSRPATLSNQAAAEVVFTFNYSTMGESFPVTGLTYMTIKNGFVYTVGCRNVGDDFQKSLPVFLDVLSGFILTL